MKKVLFLDYDGTLHDSDAKYAVTLSGITDIDGIKIWQAYLHVHRNIVHYLYPEKHDDFPFHEKLILDYLKKPYDEKIAYNLEERFDRAKQLTWQDPSFFSDAIPFLNKVKQNHILCLTTAEHAPEKAQALEKAGGTKYFEYVFDSNHLGLKDHTSSYYSNAVMSSNSRPEDVTVIGDSLEHDISAAKGAGLATIWVNRRGLTLSDTLPKPDFQAKDLWEVLSYIEGLRGKV